MKLKTWAAGAADTLGTLVAAACASALVCFGLLITAIVAFPAWGLAILLVLLLVSQ